MRVAVVFQAGVLLISGLVIAGCSLDQTGLVSTAVGSGGGLGSGGGIGNGGAVGTGGQTGSGGRAATGGAMGTGSTGGTGGTGGTGLIGTGGATGSGGATSPCNASTCPSGCCVGTRCVPGDTDLRCGTAGVACTACAPCYECSNNQACELNPSASWNVICGSVIVSPLKANGVPWDVAGQGTNPQPDPYCQLVVDGQPQGRTTTSLNTTMPVWNQSITAGMNVSAQFLREQAGRWEVGIVDEDVGTVPIDPVCSVAPRLTAADFAAGTVSLPVTSPNCSSLTIQLACLP